MLDIYAENILDHYKHPHNYGPLKDASAEAHDSNPVCGDEITVYLRRSGGKIADASFVGRGCAVSQASASMLTDEIKGKAVGEVLKLTHQDILKLLGIQLTVARLKCALLSLEAVKKALNSKQAD